LKFLEIPETPFFISKLYQNLYQYLVLFETPEFPFLFLKYIEFPRNSCLRKIPDNPSGGHDFFVHLNENNKFFGKWLCSSILTNFWSNFLHAIFQHKTNKTESVNMNIDKIIDSLDHPNITHLVKASDCAFQFFFSIFYTRYVIHKFIWYLCGKWF
jgi:hypothetical protein